MLELVMEVQIRQVRFPGDDIVPRIVKGSAKLALEALSGVNWASSMILSLAQALDTHIWTRQKRDDGAFRCR